jgi:hypothetical protein
MNIWQLAWKEWYRCSNWNGKPNSDFLWLTVLLFLTLTLALLLWGGREGLLNKFVDVSVGYIEEAGIPIWLASNYTNYNGINRNLLQELRQQNITLYPYREVEYHYVSLPKQYSENSKIWTNTEVAAKKEETIPFYGWAVSFADPLWKMAQKNPPTSTLPLEIILNRSLFEEYFNCSNYIEALQEKHLPFLIPNSTIKSDNLACLANDILWLEIKVGANRELHPFNIHWQTHIPTMEKLAFLFPLSTLNLLTLKNTSETVKLDDYYPEAPASKTTRVKELILISGNAGLSNKLSTKLASCLPNSKKEYPRLSLEPPIPQTWVLECASQSSIPILIEGERRSPPYVQITDKRASKYKFQYKANDYLIIQNESVIKLGNHKSIKYSEDSKQAQIDMIEAIGSYQNAFAYVTNRAALSTQVETLKNFQFEGKQAFYLPSTYDDALVRFRFIDKIMSILEWHYSFFFLGFLIILLGVQVVIVINHRQHNYGIFLSKGISSWQVYAMLFMQMILSFAVAILIAVLINETMQWQLAGELEKITTIKPYVDHIIAGQLDLLPLSFIDYLWVGSVVLIWLCIITGISLWLRILRQEREPAYLFD